MIKLFNKIRKLTYFFNYLYVRNFTEGPILREEMTSIINLLESEIEKHN